MKQEHYSSPPSSRDARPRREPRRDVGRTQNTDVALVAPKLTKLVATKIITPRMQSRDPRVLERERLLLALEGAQGRFDITRATDAFFAAGHELDLERDGQEPHLQILEHDDESRVRQSMRALEELLGRELAKHRPVLEQRVMRIEEHAEEASTRLAAASLRRKIR